VKAFEYVIDLTILATALSPAIDDADVVTPEADVATGR
jgi:hypothetical protein